MSASVQFADSPAAASFHDEAVRSIEQHDRRRRVFGTATAPA